MGYDDGYLRCLSNKAQVLCYNGSGWDAVPLGSGGLSSGAATSLGFYINHYGGGSVPFISYGDGANGNKATVKKYNGSVWASIGLEGFSAGIVSSTSLYVYPHSRSKCNSLA